MANKIKLTRGTKAKIEDNKSSLETYQIVYATDTSEIGVKKADGNVDYFMNLNAMSYFDYAGSIYGDKYSLLEDAWEHSLTVVTVNKAHYPNGDIEGVIIPHGVTSIGDSAFNSWTSNNQPLIIPNSVTSIGNHAFSGWTSNNQPLIIPNSVTSIGNYAFVSWTSNNQPLVIPDSVTSISFAAFNNWISNNQPLIIPNSVTSIGDYAFYEWTSNNHPLAIPNSVTSIGNHVFSGWTSNNQPLVIPNSVTSIGEGAFESWGANNQPLVIPNSVTNISHGAFYGWISNNHPLVIPSSVTHIGDSTFYGWQSVPYIEMKATTPPTIFPSSFGDQNDAPIYVPDESVDDYKAAENWVDLADRIFPISDKVTETDPTVPEWAKTEPPSALRYMQMNADNTVTWRTAAQLRGDIGAATPANITTAVSTHNESPTAHASLFANKQDKLVAGDNITINPTTNVISASGGSFYTKSTDIVLNNAYYGSHSLQSDTVFVELIAHRNGFVQGTMTFSKYSLNQGWMGNLLYPWTGQVNGILNITYAGPSTFDIDWDDDDLGSAAANYLTIIEHRFGDA